MPNKVFLFGEVGAGKSTICAAISLFFFERKGLTPRINAVGNPEGTRYLQNWIRQLRNGKFPIKTDARLFSRIDVGFVDRQRQERVGFTFFEASGETLRLMDPTELEHERRDGNLDQWLGEADTIILVGSATPGPNDRYALQNFIEYVESRGVECPMCLVLSEWDKLPLGQRNAPLDVALRLYSEAVKLLADRQSTSIIPFSVGHVENDDTIASLDFGAGTVQLVDWILDCMRQRL